uniref:Extracellular globin n=1 Tax=Globodera rostochiensis TaxID=31243 RepID=A0A914HUN2_GLORO
MSKQHHLTPPRLCFQGRSLSARERESANEMNAVDCRWKFESGTESCWPSAVTATAKTKTKMLVPRGRHLSASTDQLLADCFHHNVSLLSIQRPQHRVLPSPPQTAVVNDREELFSNGTTRYRRKSGAQQQKHWTNTDGTERRRKEFREKASGRAPRGQWRSTGHVESSTSQQFGWSKKQIGTRAEDKPPAASKRRRSAAAISSIGFSPSKSFQGTVATAPVVPKRKATVDWPVGTKRLSNAAQQLILSCLDKSRGDLSGRVLSRAIHKRADFGTFCSNLSAAEQWTNFAEQFKKFMSDGMASLHNVEQIRLCSMQFGAEQVNRRVHGFKADFFAIIANALATECVFLDGASHSPTDAIEAWAELVEMMFSSVRDGYYSEVRRQRRCSSSGGDDICTHQLPARSSTKTMSCFTYIFIILAALFAGGGYVTGEFAAKYWNDEKHMDSASPDGKKKHMDPASSKSPRRIVIILRDAADLDPRPTTIVLRC